jgi:hypothetical protein
MTTDVISMANQAIAMVRESKAILTAGVSEALALQSDCAIMNAPQSASLADKIDK